MNRIVFNVGDVSYVIDTETGKFFFVGLEETDPTEQVRTAAIKAVADINRQLI